MKIPSAKGPAKYPGGRLTIRATHRIVSDVITVCDLRHDVGLTQRECARLLSVSEESLPTWDSGRRPDATFSVRSAFGRPIRRASRAATERFLALHYRCYSGQAARPRPLPTVPHDYDARLRHLRRMLGLTQIQLAHRVGAANKAVIYQWESRKRRPSSVLWQRVMALNKTRMTADATARVQ